MKYRSITYLSCLFASAVLTTGCNSDEASPGDKVANAAAGGSSTTEPRGSNPETGGSSVGGTTAASGGSSVGGTTAASGGSSVGGATSATVSVVQVDDWAYQAQRAEYDSASAASYTGAGTSISLSSAPSGVGLATGGAKDANSFRENINNGYLPFETSISHEGVYYGYFFDRGQQEACTQLFCPTYSQMLSTDILTQSPEYYLSVGLSSGLTDADVKRKKLNLVVVLDISGSMGSAFNSYYYDQFGNRVEVAQPSTKSKMQIADQAVVDLLDHLKPGDRFGMVLFDDTSYLAKPLSLVENTDIPAIKRHILEIEAQGSTNMEAGFQRGTEMLAGAVDANSAEYENRIIFLTDAMPNTGNTSESSLFGMVETNAKNKLYTTFIGIGVDFNTTLTDTITKVRGANYYSVHDEQEFRTRMVDEFDYMVTPLVFDLELQFASQGFAIEAVYGSPEADQATGVLMRVNTLFPSKTEGGETKGGIVLLKLKKTGEASSIDLTASYKNRNAEPFTVRQSLNFNATLDVAPNTGIQKAILLSRYVNLMKEWIVSERQSVTATPDLSTWEQTSTPLQVSGPFATKFQSFLPGFRAEAARIGDTTLEQEAKVLDKLIAWRPTVN